jgi:hypothetical protein
MIGDLRREQVLFDLQHYRSKRRIPFGLATSLYMRDLAAGRTNRLQTPAHMDAPILKCMAQGNGAASKLGFFDNVAIEGG